MSDLISRQAVIDLLKYWSDGYSYIETPTDGAIKEIESLPSVEPPKGRWIGGEIGHCSCCGHSGCASDIWNGCDGDMFCPNCGARMDVDVWYPWKPEDNWVVCSTGERKQS